MSEHNFTFAPVVINRGRKFKGKAYYLGQDSQRAVAWNVTAWSTKLWDPNSKRYVYANPDFCEDDTEISPEQVEADRTDYINTTINSTIAWCQTKQPNEAEARKFARNVLLKNHPEMRESIDRVLPDMRDVGAAVDRTIQWAMSLRTRPMVIYGKRCSGGKPYSKSKIKNIAMKTLCRKGYDKLDGFTEAWEAYVIIYGLNS